MKTNNNENLEEKAVSSLKTQLDQIFKKIEEERIEKGKLLRQEEIKKTCVYWIETKLPNYLHYLAKFSSEESVKVVSFPVTDILLFGYANADADFLFGFLKTVLNNSKHLSCVRTEEARMFLLGFRQTPFTSEREIAAFDSLLRDIPRSHRIIWSAI